MQGLLGLWILLPVEGEAIGECKSEDQHHTVSSFLSCIIMPTLKARKLKFRKIELPAFTQPELPGF